MSRPDDPHTIGYILDMLRDVEARAEAAGYEEMRRWLSIACVEAADLLARAESRSDG